MGKIRKFLHDKLGWGYPVARLSYGFQPTFSCRFCEDEITKDSTGAWFHLTSAPKQKGRQLKD